MREWKATLTSEKSFSGWIFNSAQPPKGTLHSLAAPPSYYPPPRFRALALFSRRPSQRVSRSSSPAAEKLHKAQTQRFRAVSCVGVISGAPLCKQTFRAAPDLRPVIEAAPNSGYSDYLPSCSVGGRRVE